MNEEKMLISKSVAMANEVDVAGTFIYTAIDHFNRMGSLYFIGDCFFFLYHLAVGVERLQKVLLVIISDKKQNEMQQFLDEITGHNHVRLNEMIKQRIRIGLSTEQNRLLEMLAAFYSGKNRYGRFDFLAYTEDDKRLLINYIKKNYSSQLTSVPMGTEPMLTHEIREFMGRIIGRLCKKYYEAIINESSRRNLYCYELRYDSSACKVFLESDEKGSYQKTIDREKRAVKELILYLRNTKDIDNGFISYLDSIEPLPFDAALVQEYVVEICNKVISQALVDDVDTMYEDVDNGEERESRIYPIGEYGISFSDDIEEIDEW